jgi:hypothetical protein
MARLGKNDHKRALHRAVSADHAERAASQVPPGPTVKGTPSDECRDTQSGGRPRKQGQGLVHRVEANTGTAGLGSIGWCGGEELNLHVLADTSS